MNCRENIPARSKPGLRTFVCVCALWTPPILNDKLDPNGVVYIGEGGLGVPPRKPKTDRWYLKAPGKTGNKHHFQILTFTKTSLDYKVLLLNNTIFDHHVLKPRRTRSRRR